ncbi:MAG: hypothetical protein A2516_00960 [Alphaproteobacteria bacterium RIFOXYD12_FULL_60_8]|nr:MAG: hypothetical protein A2516_00960 [Alphaproteobacteria bacterium RIFOXYD12_FULL_60_8]
MADCYPDKMKSRKNRYALWVSGLVLLAKLMAFSQSCAVAAEPKSESAATILERASAALNAIGDKKNAGEAWYWLKRAQQQGADISSVTQLSLQEMLEGMTEQERWTLTYLADYHDDLDLSCVVIPPSFAPLSQEIPEPLTDEEVVGFQKNFLGLNKRKHNEQYNAVERELIARTVGIRYMGNVSIDGQIRPFGMGKDEFFQRKCNYHRAEEKIFPEDRMGEARLIGAKVEALLSFFDIDSARYVQDVMQAGQICPNRESKAIAEGLTWAKELKTWPPSALRALAAKHIKMSGSASETKFDPGERKYDDPNVPAAFYHFQFGKALQKFASRQTD